MTTVAKNVDGRTAALFALAVAMMVALVVAWRIDAVATTSPPENTYRLAIVDELDRPVGEASVSYDEQTITADNEGTVLLSLRSPELVVVTATGMLPDAIVVGSLSEPDVTLRLLADSGPGGTRTVMHFAGNFMMGRRYVEGDDENEPLVSDADDARHIVSDIAPLFSLAHLSTVNFESVIGTLSYDDAYKGRRYLLQSPPETIASLHELGVDLVTLGNNHMNDWLDPGIASTIRHLDANGIAHTGGGITAADAAAPAILEAGDLLVGIVSMTTVNGDYVNDNLPDATAPAPAGIGAEDRWQYEQRQFGFGTPDDTAYVAPAMRRPGTMWRLFDEMDKELPAADAADLWREMVRVYPEIQDWVARHGHGGAAQYSRAGVTDAVAAAREAGADLVIVQLHGGYQFAEVGSDFFGAATRAAVDAGADLVIGHHPHVLQGFEIYNDTLIAYSLGNIVFDQDFLPTHTSVVLRTVFEGTELIDASLYPVMIDGYRPVAATGEIAELILRQINEASLQDAVSIRLPDRRIGKVATQASVTAEVTTDHGRGSVIPIRAPESLTVSLEANVPTAVGGSLVQTGEATAGLSFGRDLFGYGTLEDVQADGSDEGGLEWSLPPNSLEIDPASPEGPWTVRLNRTSQHLADIVARTAARVSIPAHRWFDDTGQPVDGEATYQVRVWARRVGAGIPFVRVIFYEFDDTDPTRGPESTPLQTVEVELPLVNDGKWHELWVDVPRPPPGANTALVGVGLSPPKSQSGTVWIDGLQIIEWRSADDAPVGTWVPTEYVVADTDQTATLTVPGT